MSEAVNAPTSSAVKRRLQLSELTVAGRFMRASPPRHRMSQMGIITVSAHEANASLIIVRHIAAHDDISHLTPAFLHSSARSVLKTSSSFSLRSAMYCVRGMLSCVPV